MQSLLWLKAPCLFTSNFPGAASRVIDMEERGIESLADRPF
jgi:hypothetical protein